MLTSRKAPLFEQALGLALWHDLGAILTSASCFGTNARTLFRVDAEGHIPTEYREADLDRRVRSIKRDRNGKVVALCNPAESWSPRRVADVIKDITDNKRSYYVEELPRRSYVRVTSEKALETTHDATSKNNLDKLPHA